MARKTTCFIEGEATRLGVGNDLFAGAESIERVLVPAKNAFGKRSEILEWIINNVSREKLLILACGPTATVMALKLSGGGYYALDLGHIDIQYEYYLRGITSKQAIAGKAVNESNQVTIEATTDSKYLKEIVKVFY